MPRIRSVKPDFYSDPDLGRLTLEARYLYMALWVFADDAGRAAGDARLIKSQAFPFDDRISVRRVSTLVSELERATKVMRYEVDGIAYLLLPNFCKHQKIDRPQPPKFPEPPENDLRLFDERSTNTLEPLADHSSLDRKGEDLTPLPPQVGAAKQANPRALRTNPRANGTNPRAQALRREKAQLESDIRDCPECSDKPWTCSHCDARERKLRKLTRA